jgi:hypothetical protein
MSKPFMVVPLLMRQRHTSGTTAKSLRRSLRSDTGSFAGIFVSGLLAVLLA